MNGANSQFITSPENFVRANVINNIRWFNNSGRPEDSVGHSMILMAGRTKEANFDLVRVEVNGRNNVYELRLCNMMVKNDHTIGAYWCPFIQGNGLPGYVDIPRYNPKNRFVFTPAMNGCAFVVTKSPKGSNWLRIYHNQHPESRSVSNSIIEASGDDVLSYLSFSDYGTQNDPNAFNFLYYRNSTWIYISQPQTFIPSSHSISIGYRPDGTILTRSLF